MDGFSGRSTESGEEHIDSFGSEIEFRICDWVLTGTVRY